MYVERRESPSNCWLGLVTTNVALGCMSAGFVLAGNTDLVDIWAAQNKWGDNKDRNNTAISSAAVLGLTIGAMTSKFVTDWGRRRASLLSNAVITLATLPYFLTSNFWALLITRLIIGIASAYLINAGSLYIAEAVPSEK